LVGARLLEAVEVTDLGSTSVAVGLLRQRPVLGCTSQLTVLQLAQLKMFSRYSAEHWQATSSWGHVSNEHWKKHCWMAVGQAAAADKRADYNLASAVCAQRSVRVPGELQRCSHRGMSRTRSSRPRPGSRYRSTRRGGCCRLGIVAAAASVTRR
jgi:hypothetical protein